MRTLNQTNRNDITVIDSVGGERAFRRRLMEMGLVPGTPIKVLNVAPLGGPLEIEVRSCRMSMRPQEAARVAVRG